MFRVIHLSPHIRTFYRKCDNFYAMVIPILIKPVAIVCVSGRSYIANANSSYNTAAYAMRISQIVVLYQFYSPFESEIK